MPRNPGGILCGASIPLHPPDILGLVADGSTSRGILRDVIPGIPGGDSGGPSVPHRIQCGVGLSSLTLVKGDGRDSVQAGRARTVGTTPKRPLLCG